MHGLMADGAGGAWTFGSSILTFAFPMILFIVVAGALYVLYTKPEYVPGHRATGLERPVSYTAVPGLPARVPGAQASPAATPTGPAAGRAGTPVTSTTEPAGTTEPASTTEPAGTTAAETEGAE